MFHPPENRLVGWEPLFFTSGARKCEFAYDYLGRRIEKKVYTYDGSTWSLSQTRRYVWNTTAGNSSGWLLLLELDDSGGAGFQPARKLTWGLDLSGQRGGAGILPADLGQRGGAGILPADLGQRDGAGILPADLDGAGGIGGLLATSDPNDPQDPNDLFGDFVFCYDANGNVGQLIDLAHDPNDPAGAIKAHYEYDPYGNMLLDVSDPNQSGPYAAANPYRFSTKPWDDETGLGYWGYRYYDSRVGRWINRDPIGEMGGTHLYNYVYNTPLHAFDAIGHASATPLEGTGGLLGAMALCAIPPPTPLSCFAQFGPCYGGTYIIRNGRCVCVPWPGGASGDSKSCSWGHYWDCKTGQCVEADPFAGDVYGNCCGGNRDCSPTGCSAPDSGDCWDAACGNHDQCYHYNEISAAPGPGPWVGYTPKHCACDCKLVQEMKACGGGSSVVPVAVKQVIQFFCTLMEYNKCECSACGP